MIRFKRLFAYGGSLMIAITLIGGIAFGQTEQPACKATEPFCLSPNLTSTPTRLESISMPKIATPSWLAAQGGQAQQSGAREVTYQIATRGTLSASVDEFATQVNQTLNSSEGWAKLGLRFVRVQNGGQFTIWLSQASQVPTFSSGCDAVVSCRVGNNVVINEDRWLGGSAAWNGAGGSLQDYRRMVVNHETGHWLGHGHEYCAGAGQPAHVMQQQTLDMQGCTPNPWPLPSELYAPNLGIRS